MKYSEHSGKPLTQSQMLIWTGQMLNPSAPMYNMAMSFRLSGKINLDAFNEAFQTLGEKSDVFRTTIKSDDGIPYQYLQDVFSYDLDFIDFSEKKDAEERLAAWTDQRSQTVFDFTERLFDSALIKISEEDFVWYFCQHHLLTDGWSLTVLYKTMAELYAITLQERQSESVSVLPFRSYVDYESDLKAENIKPQTAAYWEEKKEQLPAAPRLYGYPGKEKESSAERLVLNLGRERSERLRALVKEKDLRAFTEDMSLFNVFATVLFAYMYRVSGQEDLLIGTPSHNRPTAAFKQTPGMFIEIFPMSVEVDSEDTFVDLFRKTRTETNGFLRHAQAGAGSSELSGSFNVFLNYISGKFTDFSDMPMQSDWILPGHIDPAHHLRLQIHDFDNTGEIKLLFDFNNSVFDAELKKKAPQHFLRLLDAFTADRNQPLTYCNILSEEEKTYLLYSLNDTDKTYAEETLLTGFDRQVRKTPDAPALIFRKQTLSYAQLNAKANQIAHFLRTQNIGKGKVVALVTDRSLEMTAAIYGIIKAGAAWLPIDPKHPTERINFILKDADVSLVLTQKHLQEYLRPEDCKVAVLDDASSEIHQAAETNLPNVNTPESTAYIIYTSGSTGKPKGVVLTHGNICNRMAWMRERIRLDASDVYLQKTPYTFDVSVPEFFWALQTGGSLVMAEPEGHKNPAYLIETINEHRVTNVHFVPSMLSVFLETASKENCPSLKNIYATGESISLTLKERFYEQFDIPLFNLYGPTEAAVEVTCWECRADSEHTLVPMGVPAANTQLYILDKNLRPVPQGSPGELYIGGKQVAKGYLNRPDLNAELFLADPFRPDLQTKIYKTGDLARHRRDGVIEFLGRADFQIKLRGFRIELGETESLLEEFEPVSKAIVLMRKDSRDNPYLVAFYTGEKQASDIPFVHHLARSLPEYMIPAQYVHLESFPLGSSGKVNRKALPDTGVFVRKDKSPYTAPRNEIEELLTGIWEELLEVEKIGVHDNFMDLGGHSLTAIRLVSRVSDAIELDLPIDLVIKKPTIEAYAQHIEETIMALLAE